MQLLIQRLCLSILCMLVIGCATPGTSIPQDTLRSLKSVGVISVAASNFSRQYVGVTVFGNERENVDISAWEINAEYMKQLGSAVEQVFKARAVYAPYSVQEFSRLHEVNGPWNAPAFWGPNWEAIEGAARSYCSATGVDAIAIAGRVKRNDIFGGTNQFVEGIGIYARRGTHILHGLAVVGVIDCKTAKPLAATTLLRISPGYRASLPVIPISEELARKKRAEWTREDEELLRKMVASLPVNGWIDALTKMQTGK